MAKNIQQEEQTKTPLSPEKKAKLRRILTFVGGGIGLLAFVLFASLFMRVPKKVIFYTESGSYSVKIDRETSKIDVPNDPTRVGYDFKGWYLNDEFTGETVDLTKEFKETTKLYAKWELHKYLVEFYRQENNEKIIVKDGNGNVVLFYVTIPHNATSEEIENYIALKGGPEAISHEDAKNQVEKITLNPSIVIENIQNIEKLTDYKELDYFVGNTSLKANSIIPNKNRAELKVEFDDNNNEIPVLKILINGYPEDEEEPAEDEENSEESENQEQTEKE